MTLHQGIWPNGAPCWVDCGYQPQHRGLHHAKNFYGRLFGWHITSSEGEYGDYEMCLKDESPVAAVTVAAQGAPTVWNTYFATDDVDATCERVRAAGGDVLIDPTDVGTAGRAAYCFDSTGAVFALWQADEHAGFGMTGEAGSVAWHTLLTRDYKVAADFYAQVFGYSYVDETEYGVVAVLPDGTRVCGIHAADQLPDDAPATWLTHFGVADRDSSAQIAQELGATILMSFESPGGAEAIIQAEHGEVFGLVEVDDA